ncbi:uncharacterized protein MYCFIDRAFT_178695 [Pseudocercospora fijiensis CIRAD86]|uniref:Uncharacterized protein n=1 Tax=Pseudocercospora fijiensis (strain CIRAD86) TaxID=383855 RepID=M2YLE4_PSEFD|nr:uncharacterized protein MYCFIDRAFT_178695 [Pseudocercospora fijiensis CIRAD86]EME78565.1 hypothetical protein MYCFIDRAFT_178695 [Pseudocercospora fijiensis CIRAD86]
MRPSYRIRLLRTDFSNRPSYIRLHIASPPLPVSSREIGFPNSSAIFLDRVLAGNSSGTDAGYLTYEQDCSVTAELYNDRHRDTSSGCRESRKTMELRKSSRIMKAIEQSDCQD